MPNAIPFQSFNVTVGSTLTLVATVPLAGLDRDVSFQVASLGGGATTNNFVVTRKLHDAGDWLPYLGGADFATATSKCTASTPGPHQLPGGSSCWVDVDCGAAVAIQLWASVPTGNAYLSVYGGARVR